MPDARVQIVAGLLDRRPGADPSHHLHWRLLGANNRELGRSAVGFDSVASATESVRRVRDHRDRCVVSVAIEPRTGLWTWRLLLDDAPQLTSARGYHRRRECDSAIGRMLVALGDAVVTPEVLTIRRDADDRFRDVRRSERVHRQGQSCS